MLKAEKKITISFFLSVVLLIYLHCFGVRCRFPLLNRMELHATSLIVINASAWLLEIIHRHVPSSFDNKHPLWTEGGEHLFMPKRLVFVARWKRDHERWRTKVRGKSAVWFWSLPDVTDTLKKRKQFQHERAHSNVWIIWVTGSWCWREAKSHLVSFSCVEGRQQTLQLFTRTKNSINQTTGCIVVVEQCS